MLATLISAALLISCKSEDDTANRLGIEGIWETKLTSKLDTAHAPELKGRVVFKGSRFIYTWYQRHIKTHGKAGAWKLAAIEQGNIVGNSGALELIAVAYGSFANENRSTMDNKMPIMGPSRNDYLIHYELLENKLVWMEDYNLDGDYDDLDEFPETLTYTRIVE